MEKYTWDGYTLTLDGDTGIVKGRHCYVSYTLTKDGESEPIFEGSDFGVPYGADEEGPTAAASLLDFLTLQEGDTDDEYFEHYTPRQIEFSQNEAEDLRVWGYSLQCPQCGTVRPDEPPDDWDGSDPERCDWCGTPNK